MTQISLIGESAMASPSGMSGLILDCHGLRLQARAPEVPGFTRRLRLRNSRLTRMAEFFSCALPAS